MVRSVFINGRFLTQPLTGVQRYCRELVTSLDRLIQQESDPRTSWSLLCPKGADANLSLRAIRTLTVGGAAGQMWEQGALAYAARAGVLVSLGNSGPLCHRRHLVVLHDAAVFRTPENYSWRYAAGHRTLARLLSRTARLATVSHFSQRELAEALKVSQAAIAVVPNGADHIMRRPADPSILYRLGLAAGKYLLYVGSLTRNKNLARAVQAFQAIAEVPAKMVVVGGSATHVYRKNAPAPNDHLIMLNRASDEELIALYRSAAALVFPSIYEGFGIPPLEAMAHGCLVLASDIEPVRECCASAAVYFNPFDVGEMAALFRQVLTGDLRRDAFSEEAKRRVETYNWQSSARILRRVIGELGDA
jgi:glycosyltransferase involved in cell wall biosynthesis